MKLLSCALLISVFSLSIACSEKGASTPTPNKTEEASKSAKPGSYEDWCVEHEVQESQCTKCNTSLAAAFKASNDWCAEHDLPESQCKKCNPDLKIERPAPEKK